MSRKSRLTQKRNSLDLLSSPLLVFFIIGTIFPQTRVARAFLPSPLLPAPPERISGRFAKLRQQFRSKWVRAKFRIRDHSRQVKFWEEVASGLRPSASPRPALRDAVNPHGSEKSIWTFRLRRRRFGCAKRTINHKFISNF